VFYFACLSTITPPVALSAFVGAGMAGADPNQVGWTAFRLAIAGFIVPFFFIYTPEILLISGTKIAIIWASVTGLIGTALLAISLEGYMFTVLPLWLRVLYFVSAITLMLPGLLSDTLGFALAFVSLVAAYIIKNKKASTAVYE
jgi:TRAP-type uncharacterized transport system fused permease subunit